MDHFLNDNVEEKSRDFYYGKIKALPHCSLEEGRCAPENWKVKGERGSNQ